MQGYPAATVGALRAGGINHLAGGISSAGNSIVAAIERSQAESKRLKAFRAMAVDGLGMDPDEVDQLDIGTLQGKLEAVAVRSQHNRAEMEVENQLYNEMQRRAAGDFQKQLTQGGGAITPERIAQAAAASGYQLPPTTLTQLMRESDSVNWNDVKPHEGTTESGLRFLYGKGGQFQFDPRQFMENTPEIEGYTTVPGKTGPRFIREVQSKTLPTDYNTRLSLLQDELKAATTNAGKTDEELKKLKMSGTREFYQKAVTGARQAIADHVARFQEQGYADNAFWTSEKQRLGLGESRKSKVQAGRVTVQDKDGNQFTVPAAQLEEANRQGYTEVK